MSTEKTQSEKFRQLAEQTRQHLTERIIPFWEKLKDDEYGGYTGFMGTDLKTDPKAVKGCILNSRILWFFARAFNELQDQSLLPYAAHAYEFMQRYCVDREYGGVFWSVTYDGQPYDTTKHTYNQAFAVYALSEYYEASGDEEVYRLARSLFEVIEDRCRDEGGYKEAMDRRFQPAENDKLSENGVLADRTMNTLLHLLEAYTNLYRVHGDEDVKARLVWVLREFADRVWNPELGRLEVFFDQDMHSLIDLYSYGHDIEASWLIDLALEVLDGAGTLKQDRNDWEVLRTRLAEMTDTMADQLLRVAFDGHSLPLECEKGVVEETRVWWVQAETVLGFLNAWLKHPERTDYADAACSCWEFIRDDIVDSRPEGEWFAAATKDGVPDMEKPIVEPWKCPYHNGRMCLEIMRRRKTAG